MRTNTVFSEKQQINTILLLMSRKHTKFPAFLLPIFKRMMSLSKNRTQFHGAFETAAPAGGDASELEAAAQTLAGLSRRTS
mgnify:CR=1 FL=1